MCAAGADGQWYPPFVGYTNLASCDRISAEADIQEQAMDSAEMKRRKFGGGDPFHSLNVTDVVRVRIARSLGIRNL